MRTEQEIREKLDEAKGELEKHGGLDDELDGVIETLRWVLGEIEG